mmetsp:Transcript_5560/g.14445  ORF Transcript_5560/g.14445 Transcript_5560/m.14445 type:complete len:202 (-) Transcript_5560:112-717(-)
MVCSAPSGLIMPHRKHCPRLAKLCAPHALQYQSPGRTDGPPYMRSCLPPHCPPPNAWWSPNPPCPPWYPPPTPGLYPPHRWQLVRRAKLRCPHPGQFQSPGFMSGAPAAIPIPGCAKAPCCPLKCWVCICPVCGAYICPDTAPSPPTPPPPCVCWPGGPPMWEPGAIWVLGANPIFANCSADIWEGSVLVGKLPTEGFSTN